MTQAPPNLTPLEEGSDADSRGLEASWSALLAAGINDWGGVSPLTRDWVNPEKPWPHVQALAEVTARAGFPLLPR
jgi:FO synthase